MKKWLLLVALTTLFSSRARAIDLPVEVNLVIPSTRDWINLEDCVSPDTFELAISWSVTNAPWAEELEADVFLADSDSCASAAVEIGLAGNDLKISVDQLSGDFPEIGDEIFLDEITGLNCAEASDVEYYFCIKWDHTYQNTVFQEVTDTYVGGTLLQFDTLPPDAPVITNVAAGEKNLKIEWEEPDADDVSSYLIHYREEGSDDDFIREENNGEATSFQLTGLANGVTYEVWMTAVDDAENESEISNVETEVPLPVDDFFEYYRGKEGADTGGFCFVATAAFGSYQHSMVMPLRAFRDTVLAKSELGQGLISAYYRYGPRWARAIRGSDLHRSVARWVLAPAVVLAEAGMRLGPVEWVLLGGGALLLMLLLGMGIGRLRALLRASARPAALVLMSGMALMGFSNTAQASEKRTAFEAAEPSMQFQARMGPYRPNVDSENGLTGTPFRDIYGKGSNMLVEFGLDAQVFRGFGSIMVGGSVGCVQYVGKARTESGGISSDTTILNLLPMRLTVGYHFDKLYDWFEIPLVPYVAGGLDYYVWWVLDGVGNIASFEDDAGGSHSAKGGIFGAHFSAGMKLLLDVLDREAATNLQEEVGVINTFFFAEWTSAWVDGFGAEGKMNVGDETFMFGLMMEY